MRAQPVVRAAPVPPRCWRDKDLCGSASLFSASMARAQGSISGGGPRESLNQASNNSQALVDPTFGRSTRCVAVLELANCRFASRSRGGTSPPNPCMNRPSTSPRRSAAGGIARRRQSGVATIASAQPRLSRGLPIKDTMGDQEGGEGRSRGSAHTMGPVAKRSYARKITNLNMNSFMICSKQVRDP